MTSPFMPVICSSSIPSMKWGKKVGQARFGPGENNRMDVIRHQAVSPDIQIYLFEQLDRELEIREIVGVVEECGLPAHAALCNVV